VSSTTASLRTLARADRGALLDLCSVDPVVNVMVAERVERFGSEPSRLGGEIWGVFEDGALISGCWAGVNLIPINVRSPIALDALARRAFDSRRAYSSMYGDGAAVLGIWARLQSMGWRARAVRGAQPHLALDHEPDLPADPLVRRADRADLPDVLPAAVAMFTEEVGYSPLGGDAGGAYRRRVAELLQEGRTFIRRGPGGDVVFKADLGSLSSSAAQVHGVWVDPRWRGRGICAPAVAAVVTAALADVPAVSLYVNDYNLRALAAYRRVGFEPVGSFATVLF
jgi:uncharacterized protein